ncbi:MAG: class I SAM-dependent methyltransferase [Elusimicrobia bacterium]|nr:class I SAM-dependent methyltransferase [Candidatus Liberimonas magnetica]
MDLEFQKKFWESSKEKRRKPEHPVIRYIYSKITYYLKGLNAGVNGTKILDVGCGNGFLTYYLEKCFSVVGLDYSKEMLRINPCKNLVLGDVTALPFEDKSFDIVVCSGLLHHLDETSIRKALKEMKRVSRNYVVCCEPNRYNPMVFLFSIVKKEERGTLKISKNYLLNQLCDGEYCLSDVFTVGLVPPNKTPVFILPFLKMLDSSALLNKILGISIFVIVKRK